MTSLVLKYIDWHYFQKTGRILNIIKNFIAFALYFFSAKELVLSLFSPWKNLVEKPERGFDLGNYLNIIAGNLVSIIIGFIIRAVFLIIFFGFVSTVLIVGILAFLLWILLPIIVVMGIFLGIKLIFNYV